MIQSFNPPNLSDLQKRAAGVGIVFLLALIASAFFNTRQFFQSYLIGWTFCTGIAVGSLALLMLQHLTGGGWGLVIRRVLEAATRTLPIMAVIRSTTSGPITKKQRNIRWCSSRPDT